MSVITLASRQWLSRNLRFRSQAVGGDPWAYSSYLGIRITFYLFLEELEAADLNLDGCSEWCEVIPPVKSIRGLLKKPEVKMHTNSGVQLTVHFLPVSFQSILPTNEKL